MLDWLRRLLRKRRAEDFCPAVYITTGERFPKGTLVARYWDGALAPMRDYADFERAVRWTGRLLRWRKLARYAERLPIGLATGDGRVMVRGRMRLPVEQWEEVHARIAK